MSDDAPIYVDQYLKQHQRRHRPLQQHGHAFLMDQNQQRDGDDLAGILDGVDEQDAHIHTSTIDNTPSEEDDDGTDMGGDKSRPTHISQTAALLLNTGSSLGSTLDQFPPANVLFTQHPVQSTSKGTKIKQPRLIRQTSNTDNRAGGGTQAHHVQNRSREGGLMTSSSSGEAEGGDSSAVDYEEDNVLFNNTLDHEDTYDERHASNKHVTTTVTTQQSHSSPHPNVHYNRRPHESSASGSYRDNHQHNNNNLADFGQGNFSLGALAALVAEYSKKDQRELVHESKTNNLKSNHNSTSKQHLISKNNGNLNHSQNIFPGTNNSHQQHQSPSFTGGPLSSQTSNDNSAAINPNSVSLLTQNQQQLQEQLLMHRSVIAGLEARIRELTHTLQSPDGILVTQDANRHHLEQLDEKFDSLMQSYQHMCATQEQFVKASSAANHEMRQRMLGLERNQNTLQRQMTEMQRSMREELANLRQQYIPASISYAVTEGKLIEFPLHNKDQQGTTKRSKPEKLTLQQAFDMVAANHAALSSSQQQTSESFSQLNEATQRRAEMEREGIAASHAEFQKAVRDQLERERTGERAFFTDLMENLRRVTGDRLEAATKALHDQVTEENKSAVALSESSVLREMADLRREQNAAVSTVAEAVKECEAKGVMLDGALEEFLGSFKEHAEAQTVKATEATQSMKELIQLHEETRSVVVKELESTKAWAARNLNRLKKHLDCTNAEVSAVREVIIEQRNGFSGTVRKQDEENMRLSKMLAEKTSEAEMLSKMIDAEIRGVEEITCRFVDENSDRTCPNITVNEQQPMFPTVPPSPPSFSITPRITKQPRSEVTQSLSRSLSAQAHGSVRHQQHNARDTKMFNDLRFRPTSHRIDPQIPAALEEHNDD